MRLSIYGVIMTIRALQDKQVKLTQARAKSNLQLIKQEQARRRFDEMLKWIADEVAWIKYTKEQDLQSRELDNGEANASTDTVSKAPSSSNIHRIRVG